MNNIHIYYFIINAIDYLRSDCNLIGNVADKKNSIATIAGNGGEFPRLHRQPCR